MSDEENLTRAEVDDLCKPLVQNAAKVRFLQSLGLVVKQRLDGSPLVNRQHYRRVMSGDADAADADKGFTWRVPVEVPPRRG